MAVLLHLDGIVAFKEEQKMALKAFVGGKDVFTVLSRGVLARVTAVLHGSPHCCYLVLLAVVDDWSL